MQVKVKDARRILRRPANIAVRIRGRDFAQTAVTTDVSRFGCRLTGGAYLREGTYLLVTFPGFGALDALVAWTDGAATGIELRAPLHGAVVEHLVAQSLREEE